MREELVGKTGAEKEESVEEREERAVRRRIRLGSEYKTLVLICAQKL
jgi:hypothetical protein